MELLRVLVKELEAVAASHATLALTLSAPKCVRVFLQSLGLEVPPSVKQDDVKPLWAQKMALCYYLALESMDHRAQFSASRVTKSMDQLLMSRHVFLIIMSYTGQSHLIVQVIYERCFL